jgi:hypothetical protein
VPVTSVTEILLHAERFEDVLAEYYRVISRETPHDGVQLLADYMSRHRKRLRAELEKLDPEELRRICSMPIHYQPDAAGRRCFSRVTLSPDATAAQVLDAAVTFDQCLVTLYRQTAQQAGDGSVRELFESLIRSEERDEVELKKIKAMNYF